MKKFEFRKQHLNIIQYTGFNLSEIRDIAEQYIIEEPSISLRGTIISIMTPFGKVYLNKNDYVVSTLDGTVTVWPEKFFNKMFFEITPEIEEKRKAAAEAKRNQNQNRYNTQHYQATPQQHQYHQHRHEQLQASEQPATPLKKFKFTMPVEKQKEEPQLKIKRPRIVDKKAADAGFQNKTIKI